MSAPKWNLIGRTNETFYFTDSAKWVSQYEYEFDLIKHLPPGVLVGYSKKHRHLVALEGDYKGWIAPFCGESPVVPLSPLEQLAREA